MTRRMTDLLIGGFGALNGEHSRGIEHVAFSTDMESGGGVSRGNRSPVALTRLGLLAALPSPGWLECSGRMLYATLEHSDEIATLDLSGSHESLHAQVLSRVPSAGNEPTHAVVALDGYGHRHLIVANYRNGVIGVHPIDAAGRALAATQTIQGEGCGPRPAQDGPHAHWALPLPDGRVLTTDLGADRVYVHHWRGGELVRTGAVVLMPGTGPRDLHMLPSADGHWHVAVVGEWGNAVTMLELNSGLNVNQDGVGSDDVHDDGTHDDDIQIVQTLDLGGDHHDQAASLAWVSDAAISGETNAVSESSGFVYVGLRGSDRLVTLRWNGRRLQRFGSVDDDTWTGRGVSSGGSRPRHLCSIGRNLLVANETSDTLAVFQISRDGEPQEVGSIALGSPTSVLPLETHVDQPLFQ